MSAIELAPGFKPVRRDQFRPEWEHDSYKSSKKAAEPAVCTDCGAVYRDGRWCWKDKPNDAHAVICPACHRIRDRFPAGFVHIRGEFFAQRRDEILNLIAHREQREKMEHPLARIMATQAESDGVVVTTTDIRLARALGEALHRAYRGELSFRYSDAEHRLRVHWER